MNEDRVGGATKELFGKSEAKFGRAVGDREVQTDGLIDQVSGAVQHGFGQLKDGVSSALDNAPASAKDALAQGRSVARRVDEAVRDRLGDSGPTYVLAGAIALLALLLFFVGRGD